MRVSGRRSCSSETPWETEVHLTGGEPTLHPKLPELVGLVRRADFAVCMTSNGENGAQVLSAAARAGLDRLNFSIFGTTPEELAEVPACSARLLMVCA
jgi:GTP 3',8-cyclase